MDIKDLYVIGVWISLRHWCVDALGSTVECQATIIEMFPKTRRQTRLYATPKPGSH